MTRLEFLTAAILAASKNGLTIDDSMILTQVLSRFNGVTSHQIGNIIGRKLAPKAMENLVTKGLVVGKKMHKRFYWSITTKGRIVIAEMLGEVKEPA